MPRFVILHHRIPDGQLFPDGRPRTTHWDFMLEWNGVLLTWACESAVVMDEPQLVSRLPDHRLDYLTFEGPVSGNRGTVRNWDHGEFEFVNSQPEIDEVLQSPRKGATLIARITGERSCGQLKLAPPTPNAKDQRWRLCVSSESATRD